MRSSAGTGVFPQARYRISIFHVGDRICLGVENRWKSIAICPEEEESKKANAKSNWQTAPIEEDMIQDNVDNHRSEQSQAQWG